MLRRFIIAIAIIAVLGISFKPTDASAHWRGGWGWGVGAGFLAGALIGGALARPYYYAPGPYYYAPGPYYYAPPTIIMDAAIIATVGGVMAIATAAGKSDYKKY
jgi:hypothetical protein